MIQGDYVFFKSSIKNGLISLLYVFISCVTLTGGVHADERTIKPDPSTLLAAAERVVAIADQGLASELWPYVSIRLKQTGSIEEAAFSRTIYNARRPLGIVLMRNWSNISRKEHSGSATAPAGIYVTVSFITDFAGKTGMGEHITFVLDDDGIWRIAGYALF